ncbi:hypothetical protein BD310DRAFT_984491 [Dichomitus squalens]|uniref:DUF6533 domain-containing protein n=1 Tax=Dichomitus squalens TaxID=114155 RepID=A0A4Q9QEK0_9APHY|nr:hypothetical protein BD310DRAFT_984491 [Dichomitus squalens]
MLTSVPESVLAPAAYWASAIRANNYLTVAALTILYYDFSLTLFAEIEYFWRSANWSIISLLYAINRYYGLIGSIPLFFEYFGTPSQHVSLCRQLQTYHQAFAIVTQAIVAIMLVLRTYALYDRSRRILALLIITHVGGAVACLIAMVTSKSPADTHIPLPFTYSGCDLSLTNAQCVPNLSFAWLAMLWFDTTIFTLTLVQAIRMRRYFPGGILEVLIRDGTVYYGIMVASNVSNITTFLVTPSGSNLKGMETTLTNVLSTTLTSRLILNLRDSSLRRTRRADENHLTTGAWNSTAVQATTSCVASNPLTLTYIDTQTAYMPTEVPREGLAIA